MEIKIERAKTLKEKPDQNNLGFGTYFTDHMFMMDYTEGVGWHDARIVPYAPIAMDPATGKSLGHGFVSYDSFESADLAKKQMNGQYVCQQPITVSYAFKVGSKKGEKHGDASERRIAPSMAAAAKLKKIQKNIGVLTTSETK